MSELKVNTISPYNTTAINVNTPGGFIVSGDVSTSNNVVIGNYTMVNPPVGAAASKYYVDQQFALRNLGATAVGATQLYVDTSISTNNSVLDSRYLRTTSATGQTVSGAGITFSGGPYAFGSGGVLLNIDTVNNRIGVGTTAASGTKLHVHGGSIAVSNAAQAQTAYSTVAQDSGNNLTINGYNSTVMQVAGSSKLTIAPTQITFGVTAANLSVSGSMTAQNVSVRGTLSVSVKDTFPSTSIAQLYNRIYSGGTGAALIAWDDGSSVAAERYGLLALGSRYTASSTTLAGGYIEGGNENTTDHSGFLRFITTASDGSHNVERIRINSNGFVGIGTSNPAIRLDIVNTLNDQQAQIQFANTGSGGNAQLGHDLNGDMYLYETPTGKNMRFGTNNTERLRITSDGKVGIANASPAVALDVNGEARSSTSTTSSSNDKTLTTKDYVDSVKVVSVNVGLLTTAYNIDIASLDLNRVYVYTGRCKGSAGDIRFKSSTTTAEGILNGFGNGGTLNTNGSVLAIIVNNTGTYRSEIESVSRGTFVPTTGYFSAAGRVNNAAEYPFGFTVIRTA